MIKKRLFDTILSGKPDEQIHTLPDPEVLYIPLRTRRFHFSDICVKDGQEVAAGAVLARDPNNYSLPVLSPRGGKVCLNIIQDHLVLENLQAEPQARDSGKESQPHISKDDKTARRKIRRLFDLCAWSYLYNAHDYSLPSPEVDPQAVIVSTMRLEPFLARGSVQISHEFEAFVHGLEQLQSILEYQQVYLIMAPEDMSELSGRISKAICGYASVKVVTLPPVYPNDNFTLLARRLKLKSASDKPVWCMNAGGVLAIEKALSLGKADTSRTVAIAGPGVHQPTQVRVPVGYPIEDILQHRIALAPYRVIHNGVFSGSTLDSAQKGVDLECAGLTVLQEETRREMLGFINPGFDRQSFTRTCASLIRGSFSEKLTTGIRGEKRPCVNCGFCEDVCPVNLMPYLLHKLLYQDQLEETEQARLDLCILCGLCAYVCPSKLELRQQFEQARVRIKTELHSSPEA